ncbi:MAG: hypothetical protein ACH345_09650, partial [Flavobacterium sp.]
MKNLNLTVFCLVIAFTFTNVTAQVGIGTTTPRGAFEINSTTNGFIPPQVALTSTSTSAPVVNPQTAGAPIAGTEIYNTATAGSGGTAVTPGYYYWDGSLWVRLLTANTSGWSLLGNSSTVATTNFLGTTDAIDFVTRTNNLERMRIKSNGDVGIGNTSPTSRLDVATGVTTTNTIINASGSINDFLQLNVQNTSTGTQAQSGYSATADNGSATTGFAWIGINNSTFNYPTAYNIGGANDVSYVGSGQDMYIANANNTKSILFSTGKATTPFFNERMRLTNAGDFGIGTASPAAKLDVAAGTTANNTVVNATGNINDFLQYNVQNLNTSSHAQSGYSATADNGSATTGFAWIGINNSTFSYPTAYNIGGANDVSYVGSGQDMYIANANNTKSIIFSTGKSSSPYFNERMRLTNAGKLGIDTSSPSSTLDVNGSFAVNLVTISSTSTLADDVCKVILTNSATNITITLPDPDTCPGRLLSFTRNPSSTGTVTLDPSGSATIQNLDGTLTATTTIPIHSSTGGGVNIQFWSDGTNWYR